MKEKVTSYEISKRLHELGFECESHCGVWNVVDWEANGLEKDPNDTEPDEYWLDPTDSSIDWKNPDFDYDYKSYDCWDLLMWLSGNETEWEVIGGDSRYPFVASTLSAEGDKQPQNALGKAVIKILEEKQND